MMRSIKETAAAALIFALPLNAAGGGLARTPEAAGQAAATPTQAVAKVEAPAPRPLNALIGDARAAPPEFAADALLRIAESGKITDRGLKAALLEEAFRRASDVQHPTRLDYRRDVDTRAGYLSNAYDLKLDALSLKTRAVRALVRLDGPRARRLFGEIPPGLQLPPSTARTSFSTTSPTFTRPSPMSRSTPSRPARCAAARTPVSSSPT